MSECPNCFSPPHRDWEADPESDNHYAFACGTEGDDSSGHWGSEACEIIAKLRVELHDCDRAYRSVAALYGAEDD